MVHKINRAMVGMALIAFSLWGCGGSGRQVREMTGEDYLRQVEQQLAKRQYDEAKSSIDEARRHFRTGDVDARLLDLLGDVHFQLKEYDKAVEAYNEFLKLHPRNLLASHVQYQVGMCHFNMIKPRDRNPQPAYLARDAFKRLLENYPRSAEARDAAQKIQAAGKALAESELFVAQFYFKKENYRGAIGRLETILKEYPNSGTEEEALYYLGESYRRLKDGARAEGYFKLLLERFPSSKYAKVVKEYLSERRG